MKLCFTVTNDLTYDQRMDRICTALANAGFEVELVGRKKRNSQILKEKQFVQKRLNCWFSNGKIFYLEYNFRLFLYLLFSAKDVYCAIDLDTIIPNLWVAKLKGKKLGYDAHEYFTEMEELAHRPFTKRIWKMVERFAVPKVNFAYTISNGYKQLFETEYPINFEVIRNVGYKNLYPSTKSEKPVILYQGAVNVGRGLEETIEAMQNIDAKLLICGSGDIIDQLKAQVNQLGINNKVEFKGYVAPDELKKITPTATIGLTLFTNEGLHNTNSLCNRFFDYYLAGLPQLTISYNEYIAFNQQFEVAYLINKVKLSEIEEGINFMLQNPDYLAKLSENCRAAAKLHNWEEEQQKLVAIYRNL